MRPTDASPYRDRWLKSETRAPTILAEHSACPRQSDASPPPPKEFALAEPNTSEWDAHWRPFPSARPCPYSNTGAPSVLAHPEFRASPDLSQAMPENSRESHRREDSSRREILVAAAYLDCGSSENESRSVVQRDGCSPS